MIEGAVAAVNQRRPGHIMRVEARRLHEEITNKDFSYYGEKSSLYFFPELDNQARDTMTKSS